MGGLSHKLRRTTLWMFMIVMPIGVRVDPEHPNELTVSAHGGAGQVVSVIRDCEGNPIASEENTFVDFAASMQVSHRSRDGIITALGFRSGHFNSNGRFPLSGYDDGTGTTDSYEQTISYSYFNPYIAMESRYVGIGVGYLSGEIPSYYGDESSSIPMSGHLRLGNYNKVNFQISVNEDLPLASGAGYYKMGLGYPMGSGMRLFSGLSVGFYDQPGLVQQVFLPLSSRFDLDLSARLGSAAGKLEGGLALGLRYHLPWGTTKRDFVGN